jgi:hypothetical protein
VHVGNHDQHITSKLTADFVAKVSSCNLKIFCGGMNDDGRSVRAKADLDAEKLPLSRLVVLHTFEIPIGRVLVFNEP